MKRFLPLVLIIASTLLAQAQDTPPVFIHLELAKDTLALAEPTILTVALTNHLDREILVDSRFMLGLNSSPYTFRLYMISPQGEEWPYVGGRQSCAFYSTSSKLYLLLSSNQTVSDYMSFWCPHYAPDEYRQALETLPLGTYRLYGIYRLPDQTGFYEGIIYSDTVEFVYLPVEWLHRPMLKEISTLWGAFLGTFGSEHLETLKRIQNSNTPYSEAAHYMVAAIMLGSLEKNAYSNFVAEKAHFDKLYPNSPFEPQLLLMQASRARYSHRDFKADSLDQLFIKKSSPSNRHALFRLNKVTRISPNEAIERGIR